MHKNILIAVGITILFLGVSINPAIAVNPISSDNEEDCDICPKVSNLQAVRLKSLINRVKTFNNKLSVMSKYTPEVAEKYQELFDRITTLLRMNKELKPDNPIICKFLWKLITFFISIFIPLENLFDELLENKNLILYYILFISTIPISVFYIIVANLFVDVFDCMY